MKKANNDKKKLLTELNEVLGEDKVLELFFLVKTQGKSILDSYRSLLEKQGLTTEEVRTQTERLSEKFDRVGKLLSELGNKTHKVEVTNQPKPVTEVKVSNFPEYPEPVKEVQVSEWAETLKQTVAEPIRDTIRKQLQNVRLVGPTDPTKPIAVRLSDGKAFYTALNQIIQTSGLSAQELADIMEVLNDILTELQNLEVNISVDTLNIALDDLENLTGKKAVHKYGAVVGVPATETLVCTYTIPDNTPNTRGLLKFVWGEGGTDAIFRMKKNGTVIWQARNAWTERNVSQSLEILAVEGDIFTLYVENQKNTNHDFTGGFYLYEF